ncbi:MAG: hypothetical protein K5681_05610 [Treponema sp.]|nr:hypothetical protein [Treponema sp.]
MKRFISVLAIFCLCTTLIFAQEDDGGDYYDDGYVYEQNGAGDRFLKINLMFNFPLNFGEQLYVGGAVDAGYYQFLASNLAIGGEVLVAYDVTIGNKPLILAPITFGLLYQPTIGKFEFPLTAGIGVATTSCQGETYFPGFTAKVSAGMFYRITEMWSLGLYGSAYWLPQWFSNPEYNDNGFFATAGIGARYHF